MEIPGSSPGRPILSNFLFTMFIKKIFQDSVDEKVHRHFVRFGKGRFEKRAIINVRLNKDVKVFTSFEFANDLVYFISMLTDKLKIKGIVLTKENKKEFFDSLGINTNPVKKQMLYSTSIEEEMDSDKIKKIVDECYFMLVDCKSKGIDLKIKKRLPKPTAKSSEIKVDEKFCSLQLEKKYFKIFHKEFLWDLPLHFKKAKIEHTYVIEEIVIPTKLKNEKDFEKLRKLAKRKGKIIRKATVDGKEITSEKEFVV